MKYICVQMKMKRYILMLLLCLAPLTIDAQAIYNIDATLETDTHLWTLTTIEKDSNHLIVNWEVISKKPNTEVYIDKETVLLKNCSTGAEFHPIESFTNKRLFMHDAYMTDSIRIVFSTIQDSTLIISTGLSPNIYIDSITLPYHFFLGSVTYKTPLYHHPPLITREDSIDYSDSLFKEGMNHYYNKNYNDAIIAFKKSYSFDKILDHYKGLLVKRTRYDHSRKWLARCFYIIGDEDKANQYDWNRYGADYKIEPYDRKLTEKTDSIYNLLNAIPFSEKKYRKNEILDGYKKICKYDSISFGGHHQRYALSLYNLGYAYSSYSLFNQAKVCLLHAYDIITNITNNHWLEHSILKGLANITYEENDFVSAIHYLERALKIREYEDWNFLLDIPLISDFSTLANYYAKAGNWRKALQIEWAKMNYWENRYKMYSSNKLDYMYSLDSYARTLSNSGRYKEAHRIYNQLVTMDSSSSVYFKGLGRSFYDLRDYQNAIKCYQQGIERSLIGTSANDSNSLSIYYFAMGERKKAIQLQKECIENTDTTSLSYRILNINGYSLYTIMLSNLASFYNSDEQYDSALVYEEKSLKLKEEYFPHNDAIAYSYLNMGISHGGKKQWEEAIRYTSLAYDIFKNRQRKEFYHISLIYLAKYAFNLKKKKELESYILELLQSAGSDLLSTLQELTYDERSRYIEKYSNLMIQQIPMYAYYTHSSSLISSTFDATLMMKGALLQSENEVKKVIAESNDTALSDLWEELQMDRYILSKQVEKDSITRTQNVDSLQKVINLMEDSLIVKCKEYGDITQSIKMKWQDIRAQLHPNDIAIEFLSFPINNDSIMYVALTIRKDSSYPQMTVLFEKNQLKNVSDTLYYQCEEMTDLVWKPLLSELQGIKNIYFSPSGALYKIGIEYLPGMEDYNIYRLSSTRELVSKNDAPVGNSAVLYGGLDYYTKIDTSTVKKSLANFDKLFISHADVRSMNLRGGKEKLPHTQVEVDTIAGYLTNAKWICLLDTAALGTEESFKYLSRKRVSILHIATHGFYYTLEETDNMSYDFLLLNNQTASVEDKSLTRSGLLMSGGNHILEGDSIPNDVEDGILTAKEIADVDLRGLDLVVLSACQTGLGDITQGEGVFGLQRGFKKAGAKTILMSLWEVKDEATQILMTQFYKNLLSGQNKRQSLLTAQKYLRKYNNGEYDDSKYWAAFIMLDGLK